MPRRFGTLLVLLMLVLCAATFSYLWAYAVPDALMSADVVARWPAGSDPRPRRLGITFASVMTCFLGLGIAARVLSGRQLRRIDAISE